MHFEFSVRHEGLPHDEGFDAVTLRSNSIRRIAQGNLAERTWVTHNEACVHERFCPAVRRRHDIAGDARPNYSSPRCPIIVCPASRRRRTRNAQGHDQRHARDDRHHFVCWVNLLLGRQAPGRDAGRLGRQLVRRASDSLGDLERRTLGETFEVSVGLRKILAGAVAAKGLSRIYGIFAEQQAIARNVQVILWRLRSTLSGTAARERKRQHQQQRKRTRAGTTVHHFEETVAVGRHGEHGTYRRRLAQASKSVGHGRARILLGLWSHMNRTLQMR